MQRNSQDHLHKHEFRPHSNPMVRWIFIAGGFILLGVGILGMFLPLLPTTIFFILAAWCFARSSEKFHRWMHTNRLFGKYLSNYRSGRGMTIAAKITSLALLWAGIAISGIYLTDNLYIRILLFAVAAGVTWHLLALKTVREQI